MPPIRELPERALRQGIAQLTGEVARLTSYAATLTSDLATLTQFSPHPADDAFLGRAEEGALSTEKWPEDLRTVPEPATLALHNARDAIVADSIDPLMTSMWEGAGENLWVAGRRFAADIQAYTQDPVEVRHDAAPPCPRDTCELVYAEEEGQSLDPALDTTASNHQVELQIFEGLLIMAAGNQPPEPGVASHYSVSDDGLRYTFYLRPDAQWSNGRPVVAEDFRYAWLRILNPTTAAAVVETLYPIRNAKVQYEASLQDPNAVGIQVIDPHTLEVTLEYADPRFLPNTATSALLPVPQETIEQHGIQWTRPEHIVTNGPFHLTKHAHRGETVLERSPTYWDRRAVQLDRVVRRHVESESVIYDWYTLGEIDYAHRIPSHRLAELQAAQRADLHIHPFLGRYEYILNQHVPPFDNQLVRRAFDMAVDKLTLVKQVTDGGERVARGFIPPVFDGLGYASPSTSRSYDPEAARRLLAQAGYPNGVGLPTITFLFNASEVHTMVATFVQQQLKENLGVAVNVEQLEFQTLIDRRRQGEFQAARANLGPEVFEYFDFLEMFTSTSPNNGGRYSNPEYDGLIDAMKREPDRSKRNALAQQAEQILDRDVPSMPLFFPSAAYLLRSDITGFEENAVTMHHMKHVRRGPE